MLCPSQVLLIPTADFCGGSSVPLLSPGSRISALFLLTDTSVSCHFPAELKICLCSLELTLNLSLEWFNPHLVHSAPPNAPQPSCSAFPGCPVGHEFPIFCSLGDPFAVSSFHLLSGCINLSGFVFLIYRHLFMVSSSGYANTSPERVFNYDVIQLLQELGQCLSGISALKTEQLEDLSCPEALRKTQLLRNKSSFALTEKRQRVRALHGAARNQINLIMEFWNGLDWKGP